MPWTEESRVSVPVVSAQVPHCVGHVRNFTRRPVFAGVGLRLGLLKELADKFLDRLRFKLSDAANDSRQSGSYTLDNVGDRCFARL